MGKDIDNATSYMILLIIFVFDPLAIALTIGSNIAISKWSEDKEREARVTPPVEPSPTPIPPPVGPTPISDMYPEMIVGEDNIVPTAPPVAPLPPEEIERPPTRMHVEVLDLGETSDGLNNMVSMTQPDATFEDMFEPKPLIVSVEELNDPIYNLEDFYRADSSSPRRQ